MRSAGILGLLLESCQARRRRLRSRPTWGGWPCFYITGEGCFRVYSNTMVLFYGVANGTSSLVGARLPHDLRGPLAWSKAWCGGRGGSSSPWRVVVGASRPAPDEAGRPDTRGTGTAVLSRSRPARERWEARSGTWFFCGVGSSASRIKTKKTKKGKTKGKTNGLQHIVLQGSGIRSGGTSSRWGLRGATYCVPSPSFSF